MSQMFLPFFSHFFTRHCKNANYTYFNLKTDRRIM